MNLNTLPSVAKSFVSFCSKCNGDKFHTVIAHVSADSAKVICDICKKKSTYKLSVSKAKKQAVVRASGGVQKTSKQLDSSASHSKNYESWVSDAGDSLAVNYSIGQDFKLKQKIHHSKFGLGVVTRVLDDRVEVIFADDLRQLVHRRT